MELTNLQLCLLRCLDRKGFEAALLPVFLQRCGLGEPDWTALQDGGLVTERRGQIEMTDQGRRVYRKAKVGRWF